MKKLYLLLLLIATTGLASDRGPAFTVDQSLEKLRNGNKRFVDGKPNRWNSGEKKRQELSSGQTPYACIITCADSRVPPEQIFDASLGELFVIRVAGNVTPPDVIASADYAVGHLNCPVVVVMGHTKCGAVGAALSETNFPEPLNSLVEEIRPSVYACERKGYEGESLYEGAIKENARAGAAALLSGSRDIEDAVASGHCTVLSAVYDIESGIVDWQSQMGNVAWDNPQHQNSVVPGVHKNESSHDAPAPDQQATRKSVSSTKRKH